MINGKLRETFATEKGKGGFNGHTHKYAKGKTHKNNIRAAKSVTVHMFM